MTNRLIDLVRLRSNPKSLKMVTCSGNTHCPTHRFEAIVHIRQISVQWEPTLCQTTKRGQTLTRLTAETAEKYFRDTLLLVCQVGGTSCRLNLSSCWRCFVRPFCRLRCQKPGVFRCSLTSLLLEGAGDVVYQMVPWDVDFLSSKGLRPAGPLFRFTLLEGSFKQLHLPHCQLLKGQIFYCYCLFIRNHWGSINVSAAVCTCIRITSLSLAEAEFLCVTDNCSHFLSVAHVTGDSMDLIKPDQVTESHVIINVQGFSCFGLVTVATCRAAIHGLVLLFSKLSEHSLFVLLLPRNICLAQVGRPLPHAEGLPSPMNY